MLHRSATRKGITLTETLVAMFVAALGMISLLALFPLGALQMGQALKDGRCAQAAQQGDNLFRWYGAKYNMAKDFNHPILQGLDRGNYPAAGTAASPQANPAWVSTGDRNCSYPVFVDPQGWSTITNWAGTGSTNNALLNVSYLPRRTIYQGTPSGASTTYSPLVTSQKDILRYTMLQDDMTYDASRTGAPGSGAGKVERGGRYNTLWVLQRPENSRRNVIGMTVVVFDQRAPFFANDQTERGFTNVYSPGASGKVSPGSTSIILPYTGTKPAVSKGRWIVDVSVGIDRNTFVAMNPPTDPANTTDINRYYGLRHANFYRVASVNDETNGQLSIELETPIRRNDGGTGQYGATFMLLTGTAEVFERPPLVVE